MHVHNTKISKFGVRSGLTIAAVAFATMFGTAPAVAQHEGDHGAHHLQQDKEPATAKADVLKSDLYLLDTCPVTGKKLGSMGEPVVKKIAQGGADRFPHFAGEREVRFCCAACPAKFEADKDKYFAEIDKKMIEHQLPYYTLETCIVMDDSKLGDPEMGEPINLIYQNRLVRFCCKMCVKDFNKDPRKYLAKIDKAIIEKQREHYPIETCALMEKNKLGSMGEPAERIYGNRLVKFCCAGCIEEFEKKPTAFIQRLDAAWKKSGHMPAPAPHAPGMDHQGNAGEAGDHGHGHGDGDHAETRTTRAITMPSRLLRGASRTRRSMLHAARASTRCRA